MEDELTLLLEIFNKIEKAGGQATLSVATDGDKTKVKLEITTTPAPPTGSTSTSSGRRHRHRGPRARACSILRAAAHQAALAEAPTSAPLHIVYFVKYIFPRNRTSSDLSQNLKNTILLNIYLSQLVRVRGKYTFLNFSDFQILDP